MPKKTKRDLKAKFNENPSKPADRWAWTKEMMGEMTSRILELENRVKKLESK